MNLEIIGIPLTFVVLATVLLWLIILGKGPWWLKAVIVPAVLYFSLVMWSSLNQIAGWATDNQMPKRFTIHWAMVKEPSKVAAHDQGAVFLWATEINQHNELVKHNTASWLQPFTSRKISVEPRSYRLPYSENLHEQVQKVLENIMKGKPVIGEAKDLNGKPKKDDKGENSSSGGQSLSNEQEFMFYELPAPRLPEKVKSGS